MLEIDSRSSSLKIGYSAGYWSAGPPRGMQEQLAASEAAGLDSFWTAEAYGSDALTPLAWWGSKTRAIKLGTAVCQMSARTPTALAMAALTLDHLSDGRFILGIGASGPQVVEGWYGSPFARPLERTREYVSILRAVWRREVIASPGKHYPLPFPGGTGLGKSLKSTVHPLRAEIPVFLGASGPRNVALAAEIADGWLPLWFSPKLDSSYRSNLQEGFSRPGAHRDPASFEIANICLAVEHDDVDVAASAIKPMIALYVGGMGSRSTNFHFDAFARMGWSDVCVEVQRRFLQGDKDGAIAAIPTAMVEDVALVGPIDKICDDLVRFWKPSCLTTLALAGELSQRSLTRMVEAVST